MDKNGIKVLFWIIVTGVVLYHLALLAMGIRPKKSNWKLLGWSALVIALTFLWTTVDK